MNAFQFLEQESLDRFRNVVKHRSHEIEWPNVIVTTSEKKYQKSVSECSFTILVNTRGTYIFIFKKRNLRICEQTFYICNPFESFNYEIDSEEEVETFNVHLNYGFYIKAQYAFSNSNEKLLDYPFEHETTYRYINQLHFRAPGFNQITQPYKQKEEEIFLLELLLMCLIISR